VLLLVVVEELRAGVRDFFDGGGEEGAVEKVERRAREEMEASIRSEV
jgi:hypothetical protein